MPELTFDASASRDAFLSVVNEAVSQNGWDGVGNACTEFLEGNTPQTASTYAEACFVLAICRFLQEDFVEAVGFAQSALDADSNVSEYADFLAVLHVMVGNLTKSVFYAKLASSVPSVPEIKALLPKSVPSLSSAFVGIEEEPLLSRAVIAVSAKEWETAAHWFSQNIRFNPGDKKSFLGLANCLTVLGRYQEAVDVMRGAMHRLGADSEVATKLGALLALTGEFQQSKAVHRLAMELDHQSPVAHASALLDMAISPDADEAALIKLGDEWGQRFGVEDEGFGESQAEEKDVLTVGYLVGSFSHREEGEALADILRHRNEKRFRTVGFGYGALSDARNVHFQKAFDVWHDVREMDPVTLGAVSFAEGLDIFVNIAGFSDPELLSAFGSRMAPLQVSFGATPYGAGLANMDAYLTSEVLEGTKNLRKDQLVYLKGGCQLVQMPEVQVGEAMERPNDSLTFGTNAELCELTPQSAEWWAEILIKHPNSVLLLHDHDFENVTNLKKITDLFGNFGVAHRIDIIKSATPDEFYSQIDVFLAPKSGHQNRSILTAAAMGVPVVCCKGDHAMARSTADLLTQMGMADETVGDNRSDYVSLATKWAEDSEARQQLKTKAREKVASSTLFDFKLRCSEIEKTLDSLWAKAANSAA